VRAGTQDVSGPEREQQHDQRDEVTVHQTGQ
jgi:hypothetical protein